MKTIELQCSLMEPKAEDGRSAIFTCPAAEGFGYVVSAALAFKAADAGAKGHFSVGIGEDAADYPAHRDADGAYRAELSRVFSAAARIPGGRVSIRWCPDEDGDAPSPAIDAGSVSLSLSVSATRPFVPIASLSTSDGSALSVGALDGRELYSRPIFRNVFGYPATIYYDSSIANSASHIRLPKGIRLSFLQSFDGSTWTKGDGEKVAFVNASGSTSVKFDARGSGLYAKQVDELWRIVDAYTGGYAVFNSSGYLTRVVDGYGSTLLSVTRSLISATATDQFGNTVSLSTNKLILNGGTHVLSFSKSSGYLSSITYSKGTADAGESIQFSCDATGASSIREPSGEVLRANFLSDGRVSAILKGVLQGTSFETEDRLDIAYDDQQASCTNLRGRKTDVTFDDADRVETVGDDTGGLRSIFPAGNRTFAGFASTEYLRKMLGSYPVGMYGSSSSIVIEQGQVPVLAGHMMEPGRRYCVMATVDFSSSAVPDGSSRSFVISPNFTYGSGMSLSLNFSSGHGTVRTLYGFVEPTASAGLLSVAVVFSGMPGVATIRSLSVVACSYNDFCYVDSSGSIGPFFGTKWSKRSATNAYGYRYSSGFENGYITPEDAKANALLSLRGESLFFHSGLTQLRVGDFGYGTSFPKSAPSSATVGFLTVSGTGARTMRRFRGLTTALEVASAVVDEGVERVSSSTVDRCGGELSSMGPQGGSRTTLDSLGRTVSETEVSSGSVDGVERVFSYSGNDPRVTAVAFADGGWAELDYQYEGASLNVSALGSPSTDWGGQEYNEYNPRGEYLSKLTKGASAVSSVATGGRVTALTQGVGTATFTYGLGGLSVVSVPTIVYLESRVSSFTPTLTWRRVLYGSNGGFRVSVSPYSRPVASYLISASGAATQIAAWTYGFTDADGESSGSPMRTFVDYLAGTSDVQAIDGAERSATVTRTGASGSARAGTFTATWDERGRSKSVTAVLSNRNLTHGQSYAYVAGTTSPSSVTGTLKDYSYTIYFGNSVTYDDFGRPKILPCSFDGKGVEYRPTYVHGAISSIQTKCTYGGLTATSTESLTRDSGTRLTGRTLTDSSHTFSDAFCRDQEGRIVREDNAVLGYTYVYTYTSSGCVSEVRRGTYTTAPTPSVSTWRTFGYSASWGPLLTSVGGATVTNDSGYPTLIQGYGLTWEAGRLTGFGSHSFSYDASGNLISRSGGGSSSTFVYDPSGRLLEEVSSAYSIAFIYGLSGIIGFRVRSGSAAGNYLYRFDALGNVDAIVGGSGIIARYAYDAFGNGKVYDSSWTENTSSSFVGNINPIRFKGGLFDRGTGLYKFGARWYAPSLYRWLSPDGAEYLDGSRIDGVNPYAYCYNDPVTYSDSTGHMAVTTMLLLVGIGVGAAIGATANVINQYVSNGGWDNFSWASFGWNTLVGAASGALAMSTLGTLAMVAANGALGAIGSIGSHLIAGDDFGAWQTWLDVGLSTFVGLAAGWFGGPGAMHGRNFAAASASLTKAASSCSRVLSRASSGGYATARGMQIALSRTSNGFARALGNVHFLVSGAAYDLAISLAKSAFVSGSWAFIGGLVAFEW